MAAHYTDKDNIRDSFASKSFDLAGADTAIIAKNVTDIGAEVTKRIVLLRKDNSARILSALSRRDALQIKAQSLDGAVDMIDLYVAFVLPNSLAANDELHGILFGSGRLVDGESIKEKLLHQPASNPVLYLRKDIGIRTTAFSKIINHILTQLEKDQRQETQPIVDTTLLRIKRYRTLHSATVH